MNPENPLSAFDAEMPTEVEIKQAPPLVNRRKPYHGYANGAVRQERPAHRLFLELAARGYTVKEIAERTGYTPVCINNILRQKHTQQVLVNEIRQVADEDEEVVEFIRQEVLESVKTIKRIRDDSNAPKAVRLAAANDLLNRRYGKPNQPVNRGTDIDLNTLSIAEVAASLPSTNGTSNSGNES
jgi:hypothetical protein